MRCCARKRRGALPLIEAAGGDPQAIGAAVRHGRAAERIRIQHRSQASQLTAAIAQAEG